MTEQYDKYCKDEFNKQTQRVDKIDSKVDEMHAVVTNGLKDKVKENNDRIKALDGRLWGLMGGIILSVALQVVFKLL